MDQRVSLITLGVADLERARRFYEDGLGWRRSNTDAGVVFFQLPGMVLALWSRTALAEDAGLSPGERGFPGIALAYNCRSKAEVDAVGAASVKLGPLYPLITIIIAVLMILKPGSGCGILLRC